MTNEECIKMLKSKLDGNTDTSYEWCECVRLAIKALEQQPRNNLEITSQDCIIREEAIRIAEQGQIQGYEWQFKELCNLPSVTPSYNSIKTELKPCEDVLDEIITQIEQMRDKDKIAEYPYNRCIRIVEEYKNGE